MTVVQLIAVLTQMPPEAEVLVDEHRGLVPAVLPVLLDGPQNVLRDVLSLRKTERPGPFVVFQL